MRRWAGVYLYDIGHYGGRCLKFTADDSDLIDQAFNDMAMSIRIVGAWTATLFVDQNYGGASSTFISNDPDLSDNPIGDNRASSIRVRLGSVPPSYICDGGEGVYLYEHPSYLGRCIKLTNGVNDLRTLGFDNIISSVGIVGDWTATLYRDLYGGGMWSTFTQSDPNLVAEAIGDNHATSISVELR